MYKILKNNKKLKGKNFSVKKINFVYLDSQQNSNHGIFTIYVKLKVISPFKSNFMNDRDNKYLIVHKVIILNKKLT